MNIITGYTGTPHITSAQDRDGNQGCYGTGSYILDVGEKMAATIESANEIRIKDGALSHQGCLGNIDNGLYEAVAISNGTQGMKRSDLIVCRYEKASGTNVESLSLVVIEGTPASSSPSDPSYNTGNIQEGDSPVDFPLYRVNINGVNVSSVTRLAPFVRTLSEIDGDVNGKFSTSFTSYTPTFSVSSGTNPTVANISCRYMRTGNLVIFSGRFQITALGSVGTSTLRFTTPSGFSFANSSVGAAGFICPGPTLSSAITLRFDGTYLMVVTGSGGIPTLDTGYYMFMAFLLIS